MSDVLGFSMTSSNTTTEEKQSVNQIAPALLKAQRKIGAAKKETANPFFRSKYADLGSVMEACKEALNDEGIVVLQPVSSDNTGHYVETILLHESGESLTSKMRLELSKTDMQQLGSAISYARRYGLQSMMFIPAEDNDAEGTMNRTKPVSATPAVKVATVQQTDVSTTAPTETTTKASSFRRTKPKTEAVVETDTVNETTPSQTSEPGWE